MLWFSIIFFAALVVFDLVVRKLQQAGPADRRAETQRRLRAGLCVQCGYDLSGRPDADECPECARDISTTARRFLHVKPARAGLVRGRLGSRWRRWRLKPIESDTHAATGSAQPPNPKHCDSTAAIQSDESASSTDNATDSRPSDSNAETPKTLARRTNDR